MRFGYVLLGLVTLMSVHISSGQVDTECDNGFMGVQSENICCAPTCGVCGGNDCGRLDGGPENCCRGAITRAGMLCSETGMAPCIVDEVEMCNNGLPGIQSGDVCCAAGCGECGGTGCGGRPGGAAACCVGPITNMGMLCSVTSAAPCIIDDAVVCSNGVLGIESDGVCCEAQCETCGGFGCRNRPGGPDSCCTSRIEDNGVSCVDTPVAPCII